MIFLRRLNFIVAQFNENTIIKKRANSIVGNNKPKASQITIIHYFINAPLNLAKNKILVNIFWAKRAPSVFCVGGRNWRICVKPKPHMCQIKKLTHVMLRIIWHIWNAYVSRWKIRRICVNFLYDNCCALSTRRAPIKTGIPVLNILKY